MNSTWIQLETLDLKLEYIEVLFDSIMPVSKNMTLNNFIFFILNFDYFMRKLKRILEKLRSMKASSC